MEYVNSEIARIDIHPTHNYQEFKLRYDKRYHELLYDVNKKKNEN